MTVVLYKETKKISIYTLILQMNEMNISLYDDERRPVILITHNVVVVVVVAIRSKMKGKFL